MIGRRAVTALLILMPLAALLLSNSSYLFGTPRLHVITLPPQAVLFKTYTGNYRQTLAWFDDFLQQAKTAGITCKRMYVHYWDKVSFMPRAKTQADVGCIVSDIPPPLEGFLQTAVEGGTYTCAVMPQRSTLWLSKYMTHLGGSDVIELGLPGLNYDTRVALFRPALGGTAQGQADTHRETAHDPWQRYCR